MRSGITFDVTAADRGRLQAIGANRGSPQKHFLRAKIILMSDNGLGTVSIIAATGKSKNRVWHRQKLFMAEGVDGLLRGIAPLDPTMVDHVVALTLKPPKQEVTHWTVRAMANTVGIAALSVVRIWHEHGLGWRRFKQSNDRAFDDKLHDVVELHVSTPAHAIVLAVDEKSQIQTLDRTQQGFPLKKGRSGTLIHDDKRHGTTTLFAALNILDGSVSGHNMQSHRQKEFIRFLNASEAEPPKDKAVHVILDNYAAHKQPNVRAWLIKHPRWTFHFPPTSCSCPNAVEGFFAKLTRRPLKHGLFHSVVDLQAAMNGSSKTTIKSRAPSSGRQDPDEIIAAVKRGLHLGESIH